MIVPQFWAEAAGDGLVKGRRVSVKRFGWSDTSDDDARLNAEARLTDAINAMAAGQSVNRVDSKTAYNGANGLPIREEIISRHDTLVITRNGYGARCLNTPDVLFADIDFAVAPRDSARAHAFAVMSAVALVIGVLANSLLSILWVVPGYFLLTYFIRYLKRDSEVTPAGEEQAALARIQAFSQANPAWHLRIYRTPMGIRVMVLHRLFDPKEAAVQNFFAALKVDLLYQTMCVNQNCFRARLSPKPWRMDIAEHIQPERGVWPVRQDLIAQRQQWINLYEARAKGYAACRFVRALGSGESDARAVSVQKLHDELCQALSDLPIA